MRLDVRKAVLEAVEKSDLNFREKLRIRAAMFFRPRKREEIEGLILEQLYVEKLVDENGEAQAAVDWMMIIQLVMEWLPKIIDLINSFGARR